MDSEKSKYQKDVEEKYNVSYERLLELATLFKDGLIEDDSYEAQIYFLQTLEMSKEECELFGIEYDASEL